MHFPYIVKSLSFLDEEHLLFLAPSVPSSECLKSLTIVRCSERAHNVRCSFLLPEREEYAAIRSLSIHRDPVPTWELPPHANPPFRFCHSDRIIVVELMVSSPDGPWTRPQIFHNVRLIVPNWVLRSHINRYRNVERDVQIPWSEWGPTGCRILPCEPFPLPCSTYGTKYITRSSNGFLEILEFNRFAVRRFETFGSWEEGVVCELVKDSADVPPRIFVEPVSGSLPYLKYTTQLPIREALDIALNEDNITVILGVSSCLLL